MLHYLTVMLKSSPLFCVLHSCISMTLLYVFYLDVLCVFMTTPYLLVMSFVITWYTSLFYSELLVLDFTLIDISIIMPTFKKKFTTTLETFIVLMIFVLNTFS